MGALHPVALSEQHELCLIRMKLIVAVLVLGCTLSHGAVLPPQAKLVKAVQSLIANRQAVADTFDLSRVRRSANGKAVNLHIPGVDVELEYLDEAHKYKGGKLTVNIDLEKYFRYPPEDIKSMKLVFKLDGGERLDGFFTLTVDYELHHYALEKGKFTFQTSKAGNSFKLLFSNLGNDDNYRMLPDFNLQLESDFSTSFSAALVDDAADKYDFKVFRRHGEQLVISASGLGHTYKAEAGIDHQALAVYLKLEQDGAQMLACRTGLTLDRPRKTEVKSELSAKGLGKFDMRVTFTGNPSTMEVEARYNNKVIAAAKGKVVREYDRNKHKQYKTELRYKGMGFVKEGKVQIKATEYFTEPKKDIVLHYKPEAGLDLKIEGAITQDHGPVKTQDHKMDLKLKVSRNEEVYVGFDLLADNIEKANERGAFVETKLHVSDKSLLRCQLQCFNDRSLKASYSYFTDNPAKILFSIETTTDGKPEFLIELNSANNPYHVKLSAPGILYRRIRQDFIKLEVDFIPNQHFIVKSDPVLLPPFSITKKGNVYDVTIEGRVAAAGPITYGNNKFDADLVLYNGMPLKISLGWSGKPIMGKIKAKVQVGSLVDLQKLNLDYCFHYFVFKVDVQGTVMGKALAVVINDGKVKIDL